MADTKKKPECKYGKGCYRKNPQHLKEYFHPQDEEEEKSPPSKKQKKTTLNDYFGKKNERKEEKKIDKDEKGGKDDIQSDEDKTTEQSTSNHDNKEQCEEDVPESPEDIKDSIKQKYKVEMPQDFYDFWAFAESINSKKPTDAFLSSLGLQLVGPFDVLSGKAHNKNKSGKRVCYHRHWRYYYDPPEFLTVIKGDNKTQFHLGYFRDDPNDLPVFVASNEAKVNCLIKPRGENLFAAVSLFIDDKLKKNKSDSSLKELKQKIKDFASKKGYSLDARTASMKARDKLVVTKSFHGAGIVVPVDEHEVGYRELPETDADLKKIFKKISEATAESDRNAAFDPLMEIVMLVQFANDECDYGEGLELGIDMFCSGYDVLHKSVMNMLPLAYQLLNRQLYADIITEHLKDRKHTADG